MYQLFNISRQVSQGILRFPEWLYVRNGLTRNLGTVLRYYRRNPDAVKSDHFLVKLLQSIGVPQSQNLERYHANVEAMSLNLAMSMQMTSPIYRGRVFKGIFYGFGNTEVILANTELFDIFEGNRDWQNLRPVKVLRHPRSDLALNLPDGTNTGSESGLVVVSVNIPMLAVMYRAFRRNEEYIAEGTGDNQLSVMNFIHMYVLPNMLPSHLDVAVFNRIDNLAKGAPLGESKKNHSFALVDYAPRMNTAHKDILESLQRVSKDFVGTLRTIPAITEDNMEDVMNLPYIPPTRQVVWGLIIARLSVVSFLYRIAKNGAGTKNQSEVNQIARSILSYRSDNIMKNILPADEYFDIEDELTTIYKT